ncbi:MAG: class I SAM-dependent RNA methyltransferase, partial [Myxococcales bacterium FL481]
MKFSVSSLPANSAVAAEPSSNAAPTVARVRIHAIANGGEGVGRRIGDEHGMVHFVAGVLPGEIVDVAVEQVSRSFVRGRVSRVVEASPWRVEPPCRHAHECGGCDWQHVDPKAQLELKAQIVAGQLHCPELPAAHRHASATSSGYRRRARLHYVRDGSTFRLGFRARRGRSIVDVTACPVLTPELDRAAQRLRALAPCLPSEGEMSLFSAGGRVVAGLPGVRDHPTLRAAAQAQLDESLVGITWRGG